MSQSKDRGIVPRSMRHKRILDSAADDPNASVETIASRIPSVTPELVEQVLDEYGDPADDQPDPSSEAGYSPATREDGYPRPDDLSEKQREILRVISEHPEASQRELAAIVGVSNATVSNRANSIVGFDWENRRTFAKAVFDVESTTSDTTTGDSDPQTASANGYETTIDLLVERLSVIERQVDDLADREERRSIFDDPELAHKVAHACLRDETITEEEELWIFRALLR